MYENQIAKIIKIIGTVEIAICSLGGFLILLDDSFFIGLVIILSGFVTGMMLLGFSEIIALLQKSTVVQQQLLETALANKTGDGQYPKSIIKNIEDNLPKI